MSNSKIKDSKIKIQKVLTGTCYHVVIRQNKCTNEKQKKYLTWGVGTDLDIMSVHVKSIETAPAMEINCKCKSEISTLASDAIIIIILAQLFRLQHSLFFKTSISFLIRHTIVFNCSFIFLRFFKNRYTLRIGT